MENEGKELNQSQETVNSTAPTLESELGNWGMGLIVLGVLHFLLSDYLDPTWGVVLIVVGVLNLAIRRREMFIVNGLTLCLVGLLNTFSGVWLGLLQIYWGIQEMRKFGRYA